MLILYDAYNILYDAKICNNIYFVAIGFVLDNWDDMLKFASDSKYEAECVTTISNLMTDSTRLQMKVWVMQ
jgi:hypothetical protein